MKPYLLSCLFLLPILCLDAQDDLLSMLEDKEEETVNYATASFKTNRVINLHSLENTAKGVLDFKIGHRFGFLNSGIGELFGLDNATMRLGFNLGVTDNLAIGLGRSSFEKTVDGYVKYRFLRQSSGAKNMPITAAAVFTTAVRTIPLADPDRENIFKHRLFYTYQLILGRKFSESFSLQVSPTLLHRNLVETTVEENDVLAVAVAARQKISKRLAINAEYVYVLPDQLGEQYRNSLSIGFDIETGGHVFQLHFTNSTSMIEKGYIGETVGDWFDGDIHFGFNVSRVFTLFR